MYENCTKPRPFKCVCSKWDGGSSVCICCGHMEFNYPTKPRSCPNCGCWLSEVGIDVADMVGLLEHNSVDDNVPENTITEQ